MAKWTLEIFVPFLACGCRPDAAPTPEMADLQQSILWLKKRHGSNLACLLFSLNQHLAQFREKPEVVGILREIGESGLPVIYVNGKMVFQGTFPTKEQLETVLEKGPGAT
ncbi:MAG: arsenic metallochaperone ArsD family protein [Desulfovibrionales bacterium]